MADGDVLDLFCSATREWFRTTFVEPTAAQIGAWRAIDAERHCLVVAPTGSGKTLAAFLWSLDRLARQSIARPDIPPQHIDRTQRCRVVYISPLKALAVDIERNLRTPWAGIRQTAARLGYRSPEITIGTRTGDTPAKERRSLSHNPPDILITTPESLFLILTSAARQTLRGVETIIVDEIHSICGTKRGAHLAVSLERLDALLQRPARRIGLSATVRPLGATARFLGGISPVEIVQPPLKKTIDVNIQVPVENMDDPHIAQENGSLSRTSSIWPAIERRVFDLIEQHRSTIVFTNGRRAAERLCARINELATSNDKSDTIVETRTPAEIMAQAGCSSGAPPIIARAHHGSVSREERDAIEEALKSGHLPAVIATSSLELGIDMGAVDLVIHIEAPPSVAAGTQRVGRAGHQVGAISHGVILPKHRGDLVTCAVICERMRTHNIEEINFPRNPLDVLAQHIVAMVAMENWAYDDLAALIRRASPFAELPDSALCGVLDMLSGRYPSTTFAEFRPRLIWDRVTNTFSARPGAQRLAVTSGGTIPDRGLFGVFLIRAPGDSSRLGLRVGELDEEMVYESRVGDVFLLGSASWKIEKITPDRVLVSPAPGAAAKMPFWKGDVPGRPVELGKAIGAWIRFLHQLDTMSARMYLTTHGLDSWAANNLLDYLAEQQKSTRHLPDDQTILIERFRDELGDWRLIIHCVLGAKVNAPWALAIEHRIRQHYGIEAYIFPTDDGIVIRLPHMTDEPPCIDLIIFDESEITSVVEESVGGSALFAARFRECATRALLLPRRYPGRRQPLWQQRHRAAQLLDIAREYPEFPITMETAVECLHDVFDLPGLIDIMKGVAHREIRLIEVETHRPSPFARSLLFGYTGTFLYEGDTPLAERRTTALRLDPALLGELLGRSELRELLDPEVVARTEQRSQWLVPDRFPRDSEGVAELLRVVGDLSREELLARKVDLSWMAELESARRAIRVLIAGEYRWIAIEDSGRIRDALGVTLPAGIASAYLDHPVDPLSELITRYAQTHGPFTSTNVATRFGLNVLVVDQTLQKLSCIGRVISGEFTPTGEARAEWCDGQVLRSLRRGSLAALRKEAEPVPSHVLARFLPQWQGLGHNTSVGRDGLLSAIDHLQGAPVPASALESLILPSRVADYTPAYIDELCSCGDIVWAGAGRLSGEDGWIVLAHADTASLLLPSANVESVDGPLHHAILLALDYDQALYYPTLRERITQKLGTSPSDEDLKNAIWDLVWAGCVSGDTMAPLRARLAGGGSGHRLRPIPPRTRHRRPGGYCRQGSGRGSPDLAGRWYRLPEREINPTSRLTAVVDILLERYGVLTPAIATAEKIPGGFSSIYPILAAMEDRGTIRRGYFIEGLGAAQFAIPGAADQLRACAHDAGSTTPPSSVIEKRKSLVLAATDPAHPYGAGLNWPDHIFNHIHDDPKSSNHRPGRKSGSIVIIVDGALALYVEKGGRGILSYTTDTSVLHEAAQSLSNVVRRGRLGTISVERADGESIHTSSPLRDALISAGFTSIPRGLRLREGMS